MVKALEDILQVKSSESTFDALKERGVVFHLFADSGEGVYVPGEKAVERADEVLAEILDVDPPAPTA